MLQGCLTRQESTWNPVLRSPAVCMSQPKILIIDDETDVITALSMRLASAGYRVTSARGAATASLAVAQTVPDLMILDIGLPYFDGHAVAWYLRNNPKTKFTPIIFLTARMGTEDKIKAQQAQPAGYLTKPYNAEELLDLISKSLRPQRIK